MPIPNGPLREFFSQFNFQRYTYDPNTPALKEFISLCRARQWGRWKIRERKTEFLLAVEREQDLRRSLAKPERPLQEFFSQFNFYGYTYNPHTPPLKEFEFLCQARQWGPSKIRMHETAFWHAVGRGQDSRGRLAGPNVIEFFRKYEFQRFTYDFDAPIQWEFQRLVGLRGWGRVNLEKITKQFNEAVEVDAEQSAYSISEATDFKDLEEVTYSEDLEGATDSEDLGTEEVDPLADWLIQQECPGYRYLGGPPELEFKELVRVKRREWYQARREDDIDIEYEEWIGSEEFNLLRTEFHEAVEETFNLLLDSFCQITEFEPWQILVGLYGPELYWSEQGIVEIYGEGLGSIGKEAAKKILESVFINIFDFLDAFQEILRDPPTTDRWELWQQLRPLAIKLQFPNNLMLGVYSALTNRVFPLQIAKEDGTLVLLLHHIKVYVKGFKDLVEDFKEEAGYELQEAEEEGRAGIRRLLLSREWDCLHSLKAKHKAFLF